MLVAASVYSQGELGELLAQRGSRELQCGELKMLRRDREERGRRGNEIRQRAFPQLRIYSSRAIENSAWEVKIRGRRPRRVQPWRWIETRDETSADHLPIACGHRVFRGRVQIDWQPGARLQRYDYRHTLT